MFDQVINTNEKIIWSDTPALIPFLLTGVGFLILGLIWGAIDFGFLRLFTLDSIKNGPPMGIVIPFFLLHSMPFWLSILNMLRLMFIFKNTAYIATDKRIILRSGFWGIDFKSIDYDRIEELNVNVNPIESMLKRGTISVSSGARNSKGAPLLDHIIAIQNPYQVYQQLKKVSLDVKTDWNYPNELRPKNNPGYKTNYHPS